jgi:hypothetical protein
MSVLLATLCINEMEWLPYLYEQHKNWPQLSKWVFVEAADRVYADTNPDMVSAKGLSTDGTSEFLKSLSDKDPRVIYIPHGFSDHQDPALCKIAARQRTMLVAAEVQPELFIVLDADEFYTFEHQRLVNELMKRWHGYDSFVFLRREIWRPPSIQDKPLFDLEAIGPFWEMPCCHWYRWSPGTGYKDCHNSPQKSDGTYLRLNVLWMHGSDNTPQMIHFGFASSRNTRIAKNRYYERRGESTDPLRIRYTKCRRAWLKWVPNVSLPFKGRVIKYKGPIPEVFR